VGKRKSLRISDFVFDICMLWWVGEKCTGVRMDTSYGNPVSKEAGFTFNLGPQGKIKGNRGDWRM
jgi:hypothetical protein